MDYHSMSEFFIYNPDNNTLTIKITYPYEVDLDRIKKPEEILPWIWHLGGKPWMTLEFLLEFMNQVARIKSWQNKVKGCPQ